MCSTAPGGKTLLSPTTPEFGYLEYALQLSLKASTAKIQQAYVISNPQLATQFDKTCKDILVLNSWVDSSSLTGVNTEEEVVRRGFQFSNTGSPGMKVPIGSLKRTLPSKSSSNKIVRKLLFCKVGIGRAFICDGNQPENISIPEGYDSLYIHDKHQTHESDYFHEYYINSASKILPQFLVTYEYDLAKEKKSLETPICDNCEEDVAAVYCSADKANLCGKCDTKLHQAKVASRHVRSPVGRGADLFGSCRHHTDEQIKYYCSQCHIPVCVVCKMIGNHSNGEANRHQLVSVIDAYQAVLQEAAQPDPVLHVRRGEINNQIAAVNSRAKAVEKMGQTIQHQIDEIYKRATDELRVIIKRKMDILLGDQLELKRQVGEYDRLDEFVKYQMQGDPTQFLFSWSRQTKLRAELHDFKFFRDQLDVAGGVSVMIDKDPSQHVDEAANPNLGNVSTSPKKNQVVAQSGVGLGVPKKMNDRKVQRRTSDFFAETLGEFDQFSLSNEGVF